MDLHVWLVLLSLALAVATFQAWRLRNDRRDVALLGGVTGLSAVATVVAAMA
jgi:hypothetical protein